MHACRLADMAATFKTCALLLPAHLSGSAAALDLACGSHGAAAIPIHWLLPGDEPAAAAAALADSLLSAADAAAGAAIAAQREAEAAEAAVVGGGGGGGTAAALPAAITAKYGANAPLQLLAAAGSVAALAGASTAAGEASGNNGGAERLLAWCGGDGEVAAELCRFFAAVEA